jgi:hypothetical protein
MLTTNSQAARMHETLYPRNTIYAPSQYGSIHSYGQTGNCVQNNNSGSDMYLKAHEGIDHRKIGFTKGFIKGQRLNGIKEFF